MSHRTQITLSDAQYELLLEESARSGASLAELVRQAVERAYGLVSRREMVDSFEQTFATWSDGDEGAAYVERLRRGMGRRLLADQ
ncbi:MAG: CopG family transcriptional regulator [Acidimicrobiia bacterium]